MRSDDTYYEGWNNFSSDVNEKKAYHEKSRLEKEKSVANSKSPSQTFSELNRIWRILKELTVPGDRNARWMEYYITRRYRGFYKKEERVYKLSHITQLTFTNGKKEIYASGGFKEEALAKIFDRIDKLPRFHEC
ncbi:MAG TPA: hypothetical protein VJ964_14625 [Balneolaceae bacterium]|nr:hypothetical protein [Balneolaceae bacterium]